MVNDIGIKLLKNDKGQKVFKIFFKDWYTIKKASEIYDPEFMNQNIGLPEDEQWWNHPTVQWYSKRFRNSGFLEKERIKRNVSRVSKLKKLHKKSDTRWRLRANLKPFFEATNFNPTIEEQNILNILFEFPNVRKEALKNDDINIGIKEYIELFFITYITLDPSTIKLDRFIQNSKTEEVQKITDKKVLTFEERIKILNEIKELQTEFNNTFQSEVSLLDVFISLLYCKKIMTLETIRKFKKIVVNPSLIFVLNNIANPDCSIMREFYEDIK